MKLHPLTKPGLNAELLQPGPELPPPTTARLSQALEEGVVLGPEDDITSPARPRITFKAGDVIRMFIAAYERRDRVTAEVLLTEDFTFTSPLESCIGRTAYFDRLWMPDSHARSVRIERLFDEGSEAFMTYERERTDGSKFRNTAFFILRDSRISHIHVYLGSVEGIQLPVGNTARAVRED